jgi:hypothetical protein
MAIMAAVSTPVKLIPWEDLPYIITAIALAKLLDNEKCVAILDKFFEDLIESVSIADKEKMDFTEQYILGCFLIPYKYQSIWYFHYYLDDLCYKLNKASFGVGDGHRKDEFSKCLDLIPYVWGGVNVRVFQTTVELDLLYNNSDVYFSTLIFRFFPPNLVEENRKKKLNYMHDMYEKYKSYLFRVKEDWSRESLNRENLKCNIF